MELEEPTIVSVIHTQSTASYVNDPDPLQLDFVDGRMTDGNVERLYVALPGEVKVGDAEMVGLTARQARELAESRGPVLE